MKPNELDLRSEDVVGLTHAGVRMYNQAQRRDMERDKRALERGLEKSNFNGPEETAQARESLLIMRRLLLRVNVNERLLCELPPGTLKAKIKSIARDPGREASYVFVRYEKKPYAVFFYPSGDEDVVTPTFGLRIKLGFRKLVSSLGFR